MVIAINLDIDDQPVAGLGENPDWPNVPLETLVAGKFNSPLGVATYFERNIIVAECLTGGKMNKLTRSI